MAFIVDNYNKWSKWDREHSRYIFSRDKQWYAIKEVELEWGRPILPTYVDRDNHPEDYKVYGTYEEALEYVKTIRAFY